MRRDRIEQKRVYRSYVLEEQKATRENRKGRTMGNDNGNKERNDKKANKNRVGEGRDNDGKREKRKGEVKNNRGTRRKEWDGRDATDPREKDG